jgi:hypothetical protein
VDVALREAGTKKAAIANKSVKPERLYNEVGKEEVASNGIINGLASADFAQKKS